MRTITTVIRKCGKRKNNAVYATAGEDASPDGVLERFTRLNPPVPYQQKFHRTPRIVNGMKILINAPIDEWWEGSSKDAEQRKAGEAWAIDTFGMTLAQRLSVGDCRTATTAEEAIAELATKVAWSNRIVEYVRVLSGSKVQSNRLVLPHYEELIKSLSAFAETRKTSELMDAQAAVWRMAYRVRPSDRAKHIPILARTLFVMNLPEDAQHMLGKFAV